VSTTLRTTTSWCRIEGERIAATGRGGPDPGPDVETLDGCVLVPGFVDLQVNGVDGDDFATADVDGIVRALDTLARHGTTGCLPTIVTAPLDAYGPALDRLRSARDRADAATRTTVLGVHLEGPFLGGAPGAHPRDLLRPVDLDWLGALLDDHGDLVRMVTLAPEADPHWAATRMLAARGVVVALGHTDCSAEVAARGVEAGARVATHLFNGMRGLHHRTPGLAATALLDPTITPTVIADLHHVGREALRIAFALRPDAVLVTDAVAPGAGTSGGLEVVERDGVVWLTDGTLAGSVIHMDAAVRNTAALLDGPDPLERAAAMASTGPCRVLGLADRGVLAEGSRADLVALDADSGARRGVWLAGRRIV
jgi:N-acetylglucosamine-6-phosphate deacetylase